MKLTVIDRVKDCPPCPFLEIRFEYETGIASGNRWEEQKYVAKCIHEGICRSMKRGNGDAK